jgi:preprotein translocase subunit SecF
MITAIRWWLLAGATTIVVSLLVIFSLGLNLGIDFTGGSLMVIAGEPDRGDQVREIVESNLQTAASVSVGEGGNYLIRTERMSEEEHAALARALRDAGILKEELRYEFVGPTIGEELKRKAWWGLASVSIVIVLYLMYTFRQAIGSIAGWKFGLAALYALFHDLAVVLAIFVLLGKTTGVTIDTLFVTAMLSLLGFSVNDTIVIFDRFRSEWLSKGTRGLLEVLDRAVRASLVRSLNIAFAVLLVLGALFFFGGETIKWFVVALIAGTVVGTYSSLFVAPPLLYYLAKR